MIWTKVLKADNLSLLVIIIAAILIVWVSMAIPLGIYFLVDDETAGKLGDTFGIVTSLFSSLAFGGLLYTILLQKKELSETRAEFREQNKSLLWQRFENTFFNVLELHQRRIGSLEVTIKTEVVSGKKVLDRLYWTLRNNLSLVDIPHLVKDPEKDMIAIREIYRMKISGELRLGLEDYLNSLHSLLNLVTYAKVIEGNRGFYFSILRSQMANEEKILLFYFLTLDEIRSGNDLYERLLRIEMDSHFLAGTPHELFNDSHIYLNDALYEGVI